MIDVTCAIMLDGDSILICQRSAHMVLPLKWEFPGGKIENGESKEACLRREISEELGLDIVVEKELPLVTHAYPTFSIRLYPFVCRVRGGTLSLAEHAQAIWIERNALNDYDWAEADRPVVQYLLQLLADDRRSKQPR